MRLIYFIVGLLVLIGVLRAVEAEREEICN